MTVPTPSRVTLRSSPGPGHDRANSTRLDHRDRSHPSASLHLLPSHVKERTLASLALHDLVRGHVSWLPLSPWSVTPSPRQQ
eukprot:1607950-Rhodomonas_salina.2